MKFNKSKLFFSSYLTCHFWTGRLPTLTSMHTILSTYWCISTVKFVSSKMRTVWRPWDFTLIFSYLKSTIMDFAVFILHPNNQWSQWKVIKPDWSLRYPLVQRNYEFENQKCREIRIIQLWKRNSWNGRHSWYNRIILHSMQYYSEIFEVWYFQCYF